jgi:hypothetical protein
LGEVTRLLCDGRYERRQILWPYCCFKARYTRQPPQSDTLWTVSRMASLGSWIRVASGVVILLCLLLMRMSL